MASREGLLYKFFQNWKNRRLNKAANQLVKNNPGLEKSLKKWDDAHDEVLIHLKRKSK
jgi:transposase-like protein